MYSRCGSLAAKPAEGSGERVASCRPWSWSRSEQGKYRVFPHCFLRWWLCNYIATPVSSPLFLVVFRAMCRCNRFWNRRRVKSPRSGNTTELWHKRSVSKCKYSQCFSWECRFCPLKMVMCKRKSLFGCVDSGFCPGALNCVIFTGEWNVWNEA